MVEDSHHPDARRANSDDDRADSAGGDALAGGSPEFLAEYSRQQHTIYLYVRTLVPNRSDADDVMQEVCVTLWRKWHTFDRESDFRRWAFGVAYIEVLRHRRKCARSKLWFSESLIEVLATDLSATSDEHVARLDALPKCLEKLVPEDRKIVTARYSSGGSVAEIAQTHGMPPSTLYKRLTRIRADLRRCVSRAVIALGHPSAPNAS